MQPPSHVARDLNNLARVLYATNRLAEAEPLSPAAAVIDEKSYGTDHPHVARDLNNLASLLQATDRLAEAEPLYRRGLIILIRFQSQTGYEHPNFLVVLGNYRYALDEVGLTSEEIDRRIDDLFGEADGDAT